MLSIVAKAKEGNGWGGIYIRPDNIIPLVVHLIFASQIQSIASRIERGECLKRNEKCVGGMAGRLGYFFTSGGV